MKPAHLRALFLAAACACIALAGCPEGKKPASAPPASQPATPENEKPVEKPANAPENGEPEEKAPSGALDKGATPETRDQIDPDGVVRRGRALSAEPAKPLKEIFANAAALDGKPVKLAGRIQNVCARKGCWMEVQGDAPEERVRVTAQDYGFFVPGNAVGKVAIVEGILSVKTLSAEEAKHYAEETPASAGQPKATGPTKEVAVVASGLEVKSSS